MCEPCLLNSVCLIRLEVSLTEYDTANVLSVDNFYKFSIDTWTMHVEQYIQTHKIKKSIVLNQIDQTAYGEFIDRGLLLQIEVPQSCVDV